MKNYKLNFTIAAVLVMFAAMLKIYHIEGADIYLNFSLMLVIFVQWQHIKGLEKKAKEQNTKEDFKEGN